MSNGLTFKLHNIFFEIFREVAVRLENMLAKFNDNRMKIVWVISEKHATQKWQI